MSNATTTVENGMRVTHISNDNGFTRYEELPITKAGAAAGWTHRMKVVQLHRGYSNNVQTTMWVNFLPFGTPSYEWYEAKSETITRTSHNSNA